MTNWNRVERLLGENAMGVLRQKTVGVVGLGSGGGYVALTLAMCGVQQFILVDDDIIESANIVRHVADARYIGWTKADAVADLIRQRNPYAQIQTVHDRIENHLHLLDEMAVLAVGVDGEGPKYILNEACLQRDLIAVYAGVYERGEGGDVVTIRPYQGPCYACWAESLRDSYVPTDVPHSDLDYGQRRADGGIDAEPGLWLDVVRIANTQATVVLNVLLEDTLKERRLPANTVLLASQEIELIEGQMTPTFGVEWVDVSRNANCLVCGTPKPKASALSLNELLSKSSSDDDSQVLKRRQ
jgi:molybdopterin/thiamine biosynthesis adenylyltransferase